MRFLLPTRLGRLRKPDDGARPDRASQVDVLNLNPITRCSL